MMKALIGMSLIALVGMASVPNAAAYGVCVAMCAEVTTTTTVTNTDIQTCAGNVVVQVGLTNEAHLCTEDNSGSGEGIEFPAPEIPDSDFLDE